MRAILPLLFLLGGCQSLDGIWLLEFSFPVEGDEVTTVTHNFTGATERVDDDETDWTEEESDTRSSTLVLAQLVETTDGMVLILDDAVFPGVEGASGAWTFSWTGSTEQQSERQHTSGYQYTADVLRQRETTIELTFDGGTVSGGRTDVVTVDSAWTESDTWTEEAGEAIGDIPASAHLVRQQGEDEVGARNRRDDSDCDASPCVLEVVTERTSTFDVTGVWMDLADEGGAYTGYEDAGQAPGF